MAALTYALTAVIALAPRSQTLEVRYYALLSVLLGLLLGWGFIRAVKDLRSTPLRKWTVPLVSAALGAVLWANVTPQLNASAYRCQTTPYEPQVKYFGLAQEMNARYGNGKAVVVGDYPYEYTFVTGEPALSIPESDDA